MRSGSCWANRAHKPGLAQSACALSVTELAWSVSKEAGTCPKKDNEADEEHKSQEEQGVALSLLAWIKEGSGVLSKPP